MNANGTCPTCGRLIQESAPPERVTAKNINLKQLAAGEGADEDDEDDEGAPWHFKLLMVLMVLYLAWRVFNLFR
ncbi:MAG: hypothetical protein ABIR32_19195 [Ilumatobacteraceae bacterium]